jgi:hypothetical protein
MKVLTFSRYYPAGHPKKGRPTGFVEKILYDLVERKVYSRSKAVEMARATGIDEHHPMYYIDTFHQYGCSMSKGHTIRVGNRWKVGDMASLRVWSGYPYRSKQIEFAQVEIKKVWQFNIHVVGDELIWQVPGSGSGSFDTISESLKIIASNDGLEIRDFIDWFAFHPKVKGQAFAGQILCWSDKINYQ